MEQSSTLRGAARSRHIAIIAAVCAMLGGCGETGGSLDKLPGAGTTAPDACVLECTRRDVEDPSIFTASEAALWDGRPSLGGVWVAHPDVDAPARVMIRNSHNGRSVVGGLLGRERGIPGPRLQMSSEAAQALAVDAGVPVALEVTALRTQKVPIAQNKSADTEQTIAPVSLPEGAGPPIAKPYAQVGIYSIEANATRVAAQLRATGMVPTVLAQETQGRSFWRVIVGPTTSLEERRVVLANLKAEGFSDAYAVSN